MLSAVAAFVSSLTGKVALGTAMAVAGVGAAQATHAVALPGLPHEPAAVVVEDETVPSDPTTTTTVLEEPDPTTTTVLSDDPDTTEAPDSSDEADEADGSADADEANHGQVVSEFAHTTTLEGCEKGQAIAALASGGRSTGNASLDHCVAEGDDENAADDSQDDPADDVEGHGNAPETHRGESGTHGKSTEHHGS